MAQNGIFGYDAGRPRSRAEFKKSGAAWVQFRVRFTSGYESRMRLIWYFDQPLGEWVPYLVAIEGIPGHVAYLLL